MRKIVFSIMDWMTDGALTERNKLCDALDQVRTQLGGCSVAACGGTSECQVALKGQYGWSPAYQDVLNLRFEHDKLQTLAANLERANLALVAENNRLTQALRVSLGRTEIDRYVSDQTRICDLNTRIQGLENRLKKYTAAKKC